MGISLDRIRTLPPCRIVTGGIFLKLITRISALLVRIETGSFTIKTPQEIEKYTTRLMNEFQEGFTKIKIISEADGRETRRPRES